MEDISVCCTSKNSKAMCYNSASSDDRVEELSTSLSGQLKINGARYYIEEEEEEEEDNDEDDLSEEALLAQMGYVKSDPSRDDEEEEEEEDLSEDSILVKNEAHKHEPINTPTAEMNLVSALRGSREKEGRPAEDCRVSWAPDVYDPPCTSDDHFAVSKNERHKVEQKGKGTSGRNRQKGVGSEGGGAKAAGGSKSKKKAEKKHKKHGHKYSDPG